MMKEEVNIREVSLEDISFIAEDIMQAMMESNAINFPNDTYFKANERYEKLRNYMKQGRARVVVAYDGLSFCGYMWFFITNTERIHLNEIAVLKKCQGLHIGTKLLLYLEHFAKTEGIYEIELFCMEANDAAKRFYDVNSFDTEKRLLVKHL